MRICSTKGTGLLNDCQEKQTRFAHSQKHTYKKRKHQAILDNSQVSRYLAFFSDS